MIAQANHFSEAGVEHYDGVVALDAFHYQHSVCELGEYLLPLRLIGLTHT